MRNALIRIVQAFVIVAVASSLARAAAFTSVASGNWSDNTTTWNAATVPGDGDTVTIANGHVVTVAANTTVGATTGTAHGVTINGASAGSYGKLVVNDNVTLTLKGVSKTYFALYVSRYGQFVPSPGATIIVVCASDYLTGIKADGIIDARGTAAKKITFTTALSTTWTGSTTAVATETKSGSGDAYYGNVRIRALTNYWVANSDNSAAGSWDNTSFSVTASTPAGLAITAVSSLSAVDSAGEYYLDHDAGVVYFYSTSGITSITCTYSYLTSTTGAWRGWGIWIHNDADYSAGYFDNCIFEYMGGIGVYYTNSYALVDSAIFSAFRKSESVAANRNFYVKNSTFRFNSGANLAIAANTGTAADPILIQGNTFNSDKTASRVLSGISFVASSTTNPATIFSDNVLVDSNVFNSRGSSIFLKGGISNLSITNNTGITGSAFYYYSNPFYAYGAQESQSTWESRNATAGLNISGNTIDGRGLQLDARMLFGVGGTSGSPAIVDNNHFTRGNRIGAQIGSFVTYRKNRIGDFYHHGMTASGVDDHYVTDITWENNLFYGDNNTAVYGDHWIATGYNKRTYINNLKINNNTVKSGLGLLGIGDIQDSGSYSLVTNLSVVNNIVDSSKYALGRNPDDASDINRAHVVELDYWLTNGLVTAHSTDMSNNANLTGFWSGANKYNRLAAGSRNIDFVALYDGSYTTAQTGRDLVYSYNAADNATLAWGGGTPVQLIVDTGTSAGVSSRTLTGIGKSWTLNNIRSRWLYIVSGTGSGQARGIMNSATYGLYSATIVAGGSSYTAGQFVALNGGTSTYGAVAKITSVSSGVATGIEIISGGLYTVTPADNVATTRMTLAAGAGLTLACLWDATLLVAPDFTTAIDNTSVYAIVHSEVTLTDNAAGTVRAGIYGPDFSTAGGTDSGITVTVDKTVSADPVFDGSVFPSSTATDYKIGSSSSAKDAGTSDDAASNDYFGTSRPQGAGIDIGFHEYQAAASTGWHGPPIIFLLR